MTSTALHTTVMALLLSLSGYTCAADNCDEGRWLELLTKGDAAHHENLGLVDYDDEEYLTLESGWLARLRGQKDEDTSVAANGMRYQTDISEHFMQLRLFYAF